MKKLLLLAITAVLFSGCGDRLQSADSQGIEAIRTLGMPVISIVPNDGAEGIKGDNFSSAKITEPGNYWDEFSADVVAVVNSSLRDCQLVRRKNTYPFGAVALIIDIAAYYESNSYTEDRRFTVSAGSTIESAAAQIFKWIPNHVFVGCKVQPSSSGRFSPLNPGLTHVTQLLAGLNAQMSACLLRANGRVGEPNVDGTFRFYLEAVYADNSVAPKVQFESSVKNNISDDVKDFLTLIPSQAFGRCVHKGNDPGPDPSPGPGPGSDPTRFTKLVSTIIQHVNSKLEACTIAQDGEIGSVDDGGYASFGLNAVYLDGSLDLIKKFRATLLSSAEAQAGEILEFIPGSIFRRCKVKGDSSTDLDRARAKRHVAGLLGHVNEKLENCTVAMSGQPGPLDHHGDFFFYLHAFIKSEGSFTEAVRFHGNAFSDVKAAAELVLRLVPAVEFKGCLNWPF